MSHEKHIIDLINEMIPSNGLRRNRQFESDADILSLGDGLNLLLNMDDFSPEDLLRDHDPYLMGWNIAAGGISDILATGGRPLFYSHAVVLDKSWDDAFIRSFCRGISDVLTKTGTTFAGGDLGMADTWRYTVSVLGKPYGKPVYRTGARPGDVIYLTGKIGAGNLEALLNLCDKHFDNTTLKELSRSYPVKFNIPIEESRLVSRFATCCTDTSDGLFNSLNTLAEASKTGYEIKIPPYIDESKHVLEKITHTIFTLPEILLFLGECGEFELLFTIRKEDENDFIMEANQNRFNFYRLGTMTSHSGCKFVTDRINNKTYDLSHMNIRARDFDEVSDYLMALLCWLEKHSPCS